MIKKEKGGFAVKSEAGKNLGGPYKSKGQAEHRLKQVEYFKHGGKSRADGGAKASKFHK